MRNEFSIKTIKMFNLENIYFHWAFEPRSEGLRIERNNILAIAAEFDRVRIVPSETTEKEQARLLIVSGTKKIK